MSKYVPVYTPIWAIIQIVNAYSTYTHIGLLTHTHPHTHTHTHTCTHARTHRTHTHTHTTYMHTESVVEVCTGIIPQSGQLFRLWKLLIIILLCFQECRIVHKIKHMHSCPIVTHRINEESFPEWNCPLYKIVEIQSRHILYRIVRYIAGVRHWGVSVYIVGFHCTQ